MSTSSREPFFSDLLRDPAVEERLVVAGPIGVFAPHGGGIEPGTAEIAAAVAQRTGATLYILYARRPRGNAALHVTSTAMDAGISTKLDAALAASRVAVAIHGHGGKGEWERTIFVSGRAEHEAALISAAARSALGARWQIIDDPDRIPAHLRGLAPTNFVNRAHGGGVQIELPWALRDPRPRPSGDALVFVKALADAIAQLPH